MNAMTINPEECRTSDVYRVLFEGVERIAMRNNTADLYPWISVSGTEVRSLRDSEVTVLHRLVVEQDSKASRLHFAADVVEEVTGSDASPQSASELRGHAIRADRVARRDALVEKVAQTSWEAGARSTERWEWASTDVREHFRAHARDTIDVVLAETGADQ